MYMWYLKYLQLTHTSSVELTVLPPLITALHVYVPALLGWTFAILNSEMIVTFDMLYCDTIYIPLWYHSTEIVELSGPISALKVTTQVIAPVIPAINVVVVIVTFSTKVSKSNKDEKY